MPNQYPAQVVNTILRQLSQYGQVGGSKVYKVPALSAAVLAGQQAQAPVLQFREPGIVIALYGQERAATAQSYATTRIRIQIGGSEDLFTDGNVGVGLSLLSLVGGAQNWYPIIRPAGPGVNWLITYENVSDDDDANPECQFSFLADADIARLDR
jgi:hypothetical protein